MKLSKLTITGMHKVASKTYEFNDNVTYFVGPNGIGKSTILQAVQLALLGYIPGYAKTNESAMKHASGPIMGVELTFDNGASVSRTWTRSKSTVQSTVNAKGCSTGELLGDIALPVFDFNEFKSMTANKLKDWFIEFLPESNQELDIKSKLTAYLDSTAKADQLSYLVDDIMSWIENSSFESSLEMVRSLNAKLKEDQTYTKARLHELEGTIQSLVRYDDAVGFNKDDVKKEIESLTVLKNKLLQYSVYKANKDKTAAAFAELQKTLPAETFDLDPRVAPLRSKFDELSKKKEVMVADYRDLVEQIAAIQHEKSLLPKANANCPYTNEKCPTASALAEQSESKLKELDSQLKSKHEELEDCNTSLQLNIDRELLQINAQLGSIQSEYDRLVSVKLSLNDIDEIECPTDRSIESIDEEISALNDKLIQIAANEKYNELSDKVTADKFKLDLELDAYKEWIKLTDANGLQTELMNKPFESLAEDMSTYLTTMFNKPVQANFNLISKANSFSFGIMRDNSYIEFDYLSSGEKCLFTLALMMCILHDSNSLVKTILIDDILDHLDDMNASYLFNALDSISDIQFILAGVKECSNKSICIEV